MKKLIDLMEDLGWTIRDLKDYEYLVSEGKTQLEFNQFSPAGEDFNFYIEFNNNIQDFLNELREYVNDFDIDEHVKIWIDVLGQNGVPSTIRELLEDAESIKEMLEELLNSVEEYVKENTK